MSTETSRLRKCKDCNNLRIHYARGKCERCFRREYNRERYRKQREQQKLQAAENGLVT